MSLEIVYRKTDELIPYARNARTHSPEQVQQIASSIREFGFTNPVLIDSEGGIIAGHGRCMAAALLKMDKVPTIELGYLTETQKKAYILADNKLALNAGWDEDMLALELKELEELNFDLDLTGFNMDEIDQLLNLEEHGGGQEGEGDEEGDGDDTYTSKIEAPNYEPSEEKPELKDLFNDEKTKQLISDIKSANISQEEKDFLMLAAGRHTVFNFRKIADYYSHASADVQNLMENSALVIIDFDKAIENGYITLTKNIEEQYTRDYTDDEEEKDDDEE